jgi:5,10-methylenetetrahydromethanopterin reductase
VWIFPAVPAGELVDAIVAADELGLDEVWLADEGVMREPMVVLGAAATRTTRIRLATGITSPYLRHPGAIAASIATLDELSGGRAVLGLGVGGHLSLDPFGITAERPVARLREAITVARGVLGGRSVDGYAPPDHAMPARPVPIWVGARGPQLVRTAARHADGLFLSGCTPDEHDRIVADADAAGGSSYALYQSADDAPASPTEQTWDAARDYLAAEAARLCPAAIGLSLVGLARESHPGAVALVERAAAALRDV